jgi:Tfp pilus assembly protein PilN
VRTNVRTDQATGVATRSPMGGSVRVNLLPESTKARDRASQQRALAGTVALVFLLSLGGVYWWLNGQVQDAESRLTVAQARTTDLRTEAGQLEAFRDLAQRRDDAMSMLQLAMGHEVGAAGILQDVAAVIPTDAQLETLSVTMVPPLVEDDPAVGSFNLTGKTLTSHAPGVERVLLQLDKVMGFDELYLNNSTLDEMEGRVATFSLDGQLQRAVRTERYAEGLPEELR